MPIVTAETTRLFVQKATFPKTPIRAGLRALEDQPLIQLKANEAQTLVVGGGLIVAAEKVPVQTREDLINCTLFAQLSASGEVSDPTKVHDWYAAYFNALSLIGWAQHDSQFVNYEFKSDSAEAHKAVIPVLTAVLGPQAAALTVLKAALDGLQTMKENAPWVTLFDQQARTERFARFQVATAHVDVDGILQTALVAFDLKARATLTQVLFFKSAASSTKVRYSAGRATIYEATLAQQRVEIATKLTAYRAAYVRQVKFPPLPSPGPRRLVRSRMKRIALRGR